MEQAYDTVITLVLGTLGIEAQRSALGDLLIVGAIVAAGIALCYALIRAAPVLLRSVDLQQVGVGVVLLSALIFVLVAALTGAFE